jgi:hypothetical protein
MVMCMMRILDSIHGLLLAVVTMDHVVALAVAAAAAVAAVGDAARLGTLAAVPTAAAPTFHAIAATAAG